MPIYKADAQPTAVQSDSTGAAPQQVAPVKPGEARLFEPEPWLVRNAPAGLQILGSILGGTVGAGGGGVVGAGLGLPEAGVGAVPGAVLGAAGGLKLGREVGAAGGRATGQAIREMYHAIRGDQFAPESFGESASRVALAGGEGALSEAIGGRAVPGALRTGARLGLKASGLSWPATKTALDEGIAVMEGNVVRLAGRAGAAIGGAKEKLGAAMSRLGGASPEIAQQQASSALRGGYKKVVDKIAESGKFVTGLVNRVDSSPAGAAGVNLRDALEEAVQRTLGKNPKGVPIKEAEEVAQAVENYMGKDVAEYSGTVTNTRAHEIFQDQNQKATAALDALNPRYSPAAARFHNEFRQVLRERLLQNAGPNAPVLDAALRRQSNLIMLRNELSGGEAARIAERRFIAPVAGQAGREVVKAGSQLGAVGGAWAHNPAAVLGGTAAYALSHPAVASHLALLAGNPMVGQMLRYPAAFAAPDVYKYQDTSWAE